MHINSVFNLKNSKLISFQLIGAISKQIDNIKNCHYYGADDIAYNAIYADFESEIAMLKDEIEVEELLFVYLEYLDKLCNCYYDCVFKPATESDLDF